MDQEVQIPFEQQVAELALLITALGATSKLGLYQSSFVPDNESVLADFTAAAATFAGYAQATVTAWSAQTVSADGKSTSFSPRTLFVATDDVTPNVIGGAYLETADGQCGGWVEFSPPLTLATAGAFCALVWALQRPGPGYAAYEN